MSAVLIQVENVHYSLQGNVILKDIHLTLKASQLITLIGPNGSGKSTLLKILLGLIKPTQGNVVKQKDLCIGYVPQKFSLNPSIPLTVEAFLENALGEKFSFKHSATKEFLRSLNLDSLMSRPLTGLSGGEMQKVLLARALLRRPQVLILDEPTQGMDVHAQDVFYKLLDIFCQEMKCGILLVSHDLYFVHAKSHHVLCLNQHICCAGKPQDMARNPIYQEMFGQAIDMMALYRHTHDHHHD